MERIRQRASGSYALTLTAYDEDGNAATITGTPSITITDDTGAAVDSGTPTVSSGTLTYDLAVADVTHLGVYHAVWTGDVGGIAQSWHIDFEIVGGFLFELGDLRAANRVLSDGTKYPTERLDDARVSAEQMIEEAAQVAFVPRGRTVTVLGSGIYRLILPDNAIRRIVSVTIDGTALTADELAALVIREWGAVDSANVWTKDATIVVTYEHGLERAPGPISRAAIILAVEELIESGIPSRATATTIGDQTYRITVAGRDGVTGIPYVDSAIAQFGRKRPAIA